MSTPYEAPFPMMRAAIELAAHTAGLDGLDAKAGPGETLAEVAETVLESAGRFARDVLSPLNRTGDATGSHLTAAGVATPPGFREAYRRFCADGWPSIAGPRSFGGQELPMSITAAATEIWAGANLSFAMCPEAAAGAVEALRLHASEALRERYLPPLVSGEWTAAMALTEPQAGSDLSTVRAMAEPDTSVAGDGAATPWRVRGRKIFISWGDHDLTENIVHLVLARTPHAPPGLKGISLFLVPKLLPGPNGDPRPNDVRAVSLEHKMGIRASPTCAMAYGEHEGALGWLVGPLNTGVDCLFSMMNEMRLGVGLHSTGLAERALQLALGYARERLQGRNAEGTQRPIIEHGDVRRMLLTIRALTHGARGLAYTAAATIDVARSQTDEAARARTERRLALLTPIVKACCSDIAVEVASLGVQVHGGTGYVDDSEISQIYRDARIGPIFEGTNYIQAHDLLARKVLRDGGAALGSWLEDMEHAAEGVRGIAVLAPLATGLADECGRLREAAAQLARSSASGATDRELVGAVAYPFLQWLGVAAGAWQHALAARETGGRGATDRLSRVRVEDARFYAAHILPRAHAHAAAVASGADLLIAAEL
jgi:alkylation response protein AidB-like acyl-CoA dehydrogenase